MSRGQRENGPSSLLSLSSWRDQSAMQMRDEEVGSVRIFKEMDWNSSGEDEGKSNLEFISWPNFRSSGLLVNSFSLLSLSLSIAPTLKLGPSDTPERQVWAAVSKRMILALGEDLLNRNQTAVSCSLFFRDEPQMTKLTLSKREAAKCSPFKNW